MVKPKKENQLRKFAQLSGVAFQMGITIYLGTYFGKKLDAHFETNKTYTLILTLVALALSIYSVIIQLKKINDKYE